MASCNERECNRVKLVNLGSQALRQHVPHGGARKRLSKVKTLRSAVEYIRAQQRLLVKRDAVRAHRACQGAANIGHSTLGCPRASRCLPRQCLAVLRLFIPRPQGQLGASSEDSGCKGELSPMQRELLDFSSLLGGY